MPFERWLRAARMRFRSFFRQKAADRELDDEMAFHLEQSAAEWMARGVAAEEARRRAAGALGSAQSKDACRDARGFTALRAIARDAALAARLVLRQPVFSAAVVATLAVGLGAAISTANIANWLLVRPVPGVVDPSSLFSIRLHGDAGSRARMALNDVDHLSQRRDVVAGVTGSFDVPTTVSVAVPGVSAQRTAIDFVMANYFDVLGTTVSGRTFTKEEEQLPSAARVAIVGDRLAGSLGDALVGRTVLVNGESVLVVGVTRGRFRGPRRAAPVDIWMPLAQQWIGLPPGGEPPATIGPRRPSMFGLIGRRSADQSTDLLQQQVSAIQQTIKGSLPARNQQYAAHNLQVFETLERYPRDVATLARWVRTLTMAGLLLLVLACANVGNAMVARSTARAGELATRLALGAARRMLVRTLLFESLLLALVAGVVGVGVAALVSRALEGVSLMATLPPLDRPQMDWRVLAFGIGACGVAAVGAGLWPVWSVRKADIAAVLQAARRSVSPGRRRLTETLTIAQVAIAVVLVIGAALFVRSTATKLGLDVGIEREQVQTFRLDPRSPDDQTAYALRRALIERLAALPGVRRATVAFLPPFFTGNEARLTFRADGAPEDSAHESVMLNAVHPGFFDILGLPLVAGRDFVEADFQIPVEASPVILAESVARRVFGTVDVVGRVVVTPTGRRHPVVGVAADSRQRVLTSEDTTDLAFQPFRVDYSTPFLTGIVSLEEPGLDVWPDVRRMLAEVAPSVVMFEAKSVDEGIRASIGQDILTMRIVTILGSLAVFLAGVGLASVLSRSLLERRREFGIRSALGATPLGLAVLVGRQAFGVVVGGITAGTFAAVWLSRFVESRLYGIARFDPASFVSSLVLVFVVIAAVSLPVCRRASRVQPAAVLKEP